MRPHIAQAGVALALVHLCSQYNKKPSVLQFVVKGLLLSNSQLRVLSLVMHQHIFGGVFSSLN